MNINQMTEEERRAYEWALNQQYQSVAARDARTLAKFIQRTNEGTTNNTEKTCIRCGGTQFQAAPTHTGLCAQCWQRQYGSLDRQLEKEMTHGK